MNEKEKLGNKIRKLRKEAELSLSELAEKIDKTSSYLSQVERGLAEPSITALRQIANALEVPMFHFLIDDEKHSSLVKKEDRKILKMPDSHISFELISPDLSHQMEIIEFRLDPGASTSEILQSHQGEECSLVIKGKMEIEIGDKVYVLDEGDSLYYLASVPHRNTNIGDDELIFISAITPPKF